MDTPDIEPQVCPWCGTVLPRNVGGWMLRNPDEDEDDPVDEYQCVEGCGRSFFV